jgi:hypothetical protein
VPPRRTTATPTSTFDWSPLLDAAGFDAAALQPTSSIWSAPVDTDLKQAWTGVYAGQPKLRMHIEAAAFRGKPVWFSVKGPWAPTQRAGESPFLQQVVWVALAFSVMTLVGIAVMLRRNLRLGRGDRRGAMVLARLIVVSLVLALLIRADHAASVIVETRLVANIIAQALYFAIAAWALYLSFEPYARRRWPDLMISWSRLLAGRLRDPMVGRDLLIGALGGIAMALMVHLDIALPSGFGHVQHAPIGQIASSLSSARQLGYFFLINVYNAMGFGLASLIGMLVVQAITRSRWLALALQFTIAYLFFLVAVSTNPPFSGALALSTLIWFALLVRVGLLASGAGVYFFTLLNSIPMTLDASAWYFSRGLIGLGVLSAILFYAFYVALGGKALISHSLLEGDGSR